MLDWLRSRLGRPGAPGTASGALSPLQLYRTGDLEAAAQAAAATLAGDPENASALLVQALVAIDQGQVREAMRVLEPALAANPASADLHVALARAHTAAGRQRAAQQALERAQALQPEHAGAALQQGLLALSAGRKDEAVRWLEAAVRSDAALAEAHLHLAGLQREAGRLDLAERHYRRAIEGRPRDAAALSDFGALLKDKGQSAEAARLLQRALEIRPDFAPASFNLAMLRVGEQAWAEAATLLRGSLAADAQQADAWYWLGNACMGMGDTAAAREAYGRALRLDGRYAQARWGHAMAQLAAVPADAAQQEEGAAAFARELGKLERWFATQRPSDGYRAVGAQQPFYLAYVEGDHSAVLKQYGTLCTSLMAQWARKAGVPSPVKATGSKLRIGIVSGHIHSHSVWHAIVRGWVEHLDPAQFELHVFHTGQARDAQTEWAARRVAKLHHAPHDWMAWAKTISDSRLDVLISPEVGMDATTVRLAALRLAPVQLASWGHPLTTGLPTIDGFVSAEAFEPTGAAAHYTERLIALPRLGCCYRPYGASATQPDLAAWGIGPDDRILLCAGTPFKYAPRHDALLVDIARRCRPCKLVFFRAQNEALSGLLERRLRGAFEGAGLPFDECVRFVPWQPQAAFFGLLDRADVYLDTPGFSGFNTAMQAIERATPIVAWEGDFMRGRFASGILGQMGLRQWVAASPEGYAALVEQLCEDRAARDALRGQIAASRALLYDDKASVAALARQLVELAAR